MISEHEWKEFLLSQGVLENQTEILLDYVRKLNAGGFPVIFEFQHLSMLLGFDSNVLAQLILNSQKSYRCFTIPKRRGGERAISSPYPAIASCQKWILKNILLKIDPGQYSYAFRADKNIIDNASVHLNNDEILKIDIHDFFGSIGMERVISIFKNAGYSNLLSFHLASICCFQGSLPQGASTSPALSNIVAKRLDNRLCALSAKLGLVYSRYADDIVFSGEKVPKNLVSLIRRVILDEGFKLNEEKTVFKGKGQKKIVTGLCVTGDRVRVPKKYRRRFRQECYCFLKNGVVIPRSFDGQLDPLYIYRLIGQASFILSVEPDNDYAKSSLVKLKEILNRYSSVVG